MRPFDGRRVLLGVAGGIAAYKGAELARRLTQAGALVDVVLTESGARFIGPATFDGLTGRPTRRSLWERALDHIELGRSADAIVVAPATADLLARLAGGLADDLLTTTLLAAPRRAILAPAMNHRMFAHPATQRNLATLQEFGHSIVGPDYGEMAEREVGWGRMAEPLLLLAHVGRALEAESGWRGRRVVVTAGPTREPVDAVRFLGNRSSGRMGYAIAASAWRRGASVTLITGPSQLGVPDGLDHVRRVETAEQMRDALAEAAPEADALFMVAAVADYRPSESVTRKIRRSEGMKKLDLEAVEDLLAGVETRADCVRVAFAVEIGEEGRENARAKLESKRAHLIVVNDPTEPGSGFETETNRVALIARGGEEESLSRMPKTEVAEIVLDRTEPLLSSE